MAISVFHLYSIGIGPSSSHTVGPMRAAFQFVNLLNQRGLISTIDSVKIDLYGSLALTGKGHGTDFAVLLGLEGETPENIDPAMIQEKVRRIRDAQTLNLSGIKHTFFKESTQLLFHKDKQLPAHPNGMRFTAYSADQAEVISKVYYSIGGGFVLEHKEIWEPKTLGEEDHKLPFPFSTGNELLKLCEENNMRIEDIMMENEKTWRSEQQVREGLLKIWSVMQDCVERGCEQDGILPGGLNVKRRASGILRNLRAAEKAHVVDPVSVMKWVSLWALAVNEENASGSRVVTAPTNGAAGIMPAVMHYYKKFTKNASDEGIITFLLTAGAMGILFKVGASISAAEMGCMGEVGVACSMAAAGLTAALGGSVLQVEDAAEIGMEHNLGLTCDPVMGLVQIPCIERNTMGSVKAINASLLALEGDGKSHRVSLDQVIATMRQTGRDMQSIYKETSLGGLAVNVPEC